MKLYFENNTEEKINKNEFVEIGEKIISKLAKPSRTEVGLHLVGDKEIQELNQKYRSKNEPTDVLSFPLDKPGEKTTGPHLLGDIFISVPTATRNARKRNISPKKEIICLFVHGLMHLLGFDHKKDQPQWDKAEIVVRNLLWT